MKISDKFKNGRKVLSFEVFPPKKESPIEVIYSTLDELRSLNPDFISVTYGAGGTGASNVTCEIASKIINTFNTDAMAHLTCVNNTADDIRKILADFKENGIENILALRGDIVPGTEPKKDFAHASDLISFIKAEDESFSLSGACYPECHMEALNEVDDVLNLKRKVDAGAEHLISQLFFDNDAFYRFKERAAIAGINVPIEAGIMPVVNKKQIERMVSMCGASLPAKFSRMMQKYGDNPQAIRDAGIAYAIDQIVDLLANGADGIHLYTMNNPYIAKKISDAVINIIRD